MTVCIDCKYSKPIYALKVIGENGKEDVTKQVNSVYMFCSKANRLEVYDHECTIQFD